MAGLNIVVCQWVSLVAKKCKVRLNSYSKCMLDDFNTPDYEVIGRCDIIHGRELLGSVSDWPELIAKCFR